MDKKKISIILPVYNGSDYLAESIESVINQTYTNWELIIVNDCSTDNSLAIASSYAAKDARIKVFSNKINLKLPNTLNEGFKHASGEYYTWTSDDNKYKSDALRIMLQYLDNNPTAVMVYADYTCIDSKGKVIGLAKKKNSKYIFADNVIGACFLYTANAAKSAGQYDQTLFLAEDYDFWLRLHKTGDILHIEKDLYYYRMHNKSLTETKKKFIDEQTYKVLKKHFQYAYTKSVENNLCYEFFDHMLSRATAHYNDTLSMLLTINKGYRSHVRWQKIKFFINWNGIKLFIWKSRAWQMLLKFKRAL